MRNWQRLVSVIETVSLVGPANLLSLLVMTSLSLFVLGVRFISQGYYRFFFSSK